jgi:tetraacyldisaccharide 4'-kinase
MIRRIYEIALFPLSLLYGTVVWIRNFLFDRGILPSREFSIPVISIGNLSVGGTGKTPHAEYIIRLLLPYYRIALLSRGYKRKTKGFIMANSSDNASTIGDEPAQMMNKFPGVTVAVDSSRVNGINEILKRDPDTEVIILDDAFQHRWITPGLSIIISPFNRLFTRDRLLPAGRLREPASGSRRADIILISSTPANTLPMDKRIILRETGLMSHQNIWFTSIEYGSLHNIHNCEESELTLDDLREMQSEILLVTGIADPDGIMEYLKSYSPAVTHISFRDHHSYKENDIERIKEKLSKLNPSNRCIITTEKDSVRLRLAASLREHFDDNFYYLPITITLVDDEMKEFDNYIKEYVEKNRKNRTIS